MMTGQAFKTDKVIDERFLGIVEDSIYYNPQLTRDDKDALVTSLYQWFYAVSEKPVQFSLSNPYTVPLADEADRLIPELVAALEKTVAGCVICDGGFVEYQPSGLDGWLPTGDANFVTEPCPNCSEARTVIAKVKK